MKRLPARRGALGRLTAFLLWALPAAAGAALALGEAPTVERVRDLIFDQYQALSPRAWSPDLPVRVVDIDEESLARLGQWPWPRDKLASLTAALRTRGAAAIAYDVIFSEPDRSSPERILDALPELPEKEALARALTSVVSHDDAFANEVAAAPVVLAVALTHRAPDAQAPPPAMKGAFAVAGDDPRRFVPRFGGMSTPLPLLAASAAGLGAINFIPDRDLVLRSAPLLLARKDSSAEGAALVPSLALEALRVAQGATTIVVKSSNASGEKALGGAATGVVAVKVGDVEIATGRDGAARIRYAGSQAARHIPAWRVMTGAVDPAEIDGRIVFVGASAAALVDLRSTPLEGAVAGVDVHAELVEHAMSGARLARPDYAPGLEAFLVVLAAAAVGFMARRLGPAPAALVAAAMAGAAFVASFAAFRWGDVLVDAVVPSLTTVAAYGWTTIAVYRRAERERRSVRDAFGRYLSPVMVQRLADDPASLRLGGETRVVTALFSDARGFTARSETLDAQGVVEFLNRLHTPTTAAVLAEGGTIDKYIGDGLMAFWNAPLATPDHAVAACRAALAMQRAIAALDVAMAAEAAAAGRAHRPVRIGVGVNTGEAFVGNMGSTQRFDYSIVGDMVNVASRLESATKELGVDILVSRETREAADGAMRCLDAGAIELKGKSEAVRAYVLLGPAAAGDGFAALEAAHDAAMAARDLPAFDAAREALRRVPGADRLETFYARRRAALALNRPS
ncbi:MAG: adenylate/guanylate cyclase domain-containing protein [Rhizobiales bacterium]|nr:adenylate/guanylate cyclase domain-containing protein [Hyphomicrobiales bacterium]